MNKMRHLNQEIPGRVLGLMLCMGVMLVLPARAQSEDLSRASGDTLAASGDLLGTSFQLSGEVVLAVGEPVAEIVVAVAKGTGLIIKDAAVMSMDVTTGGLKLVTRPLAFSADALSGSGEARVQQPVVKRITVMTAADALALMQAVESKDGLTDDVRRLLSDLDFQPEQLEGSVLVREGLARFSENGEELVFGIKADDMLLLVSMDELEQATSQQTENGL